MNSVPRFAVIDLHCDLLSYLADDVLHRTPHDRIARSSLPDTREGGVLLQVLAIFTKSDSGSVAYGATQATLFSELELRHPDEVRRVRRPADLDTEVGSPLLVIAAFENASGICTENESIAAGLERLTSYQRSIGPILYVSLTWWDENRFGGGNGTTVGLKDDGRRLLDHLAKLGIAVDLSHTSDALADGILSHIDTHALPLRVLASHSNYRTVTDVARNLPDDLAREVFRRRGIVGCNAIEEFVGGTAPEAITAHIVHGLTLGGRHAIALGADFFCEDDIPIEYRPPNGRPMFIPLLERSGDYPALFSHLQRDGRLDIPTIEALANRNARRFVEEVIGAQRTA